MLRFLTGWVLSVLWLSACSLIPRQEDMGPTPCAGPCSGFSDRKTGNMTGCDDAGAVESDWDRQQAKENADAYCRARCSDPGCACGGGRYRTETASKREKPAAWGPASCEIVQRTTYVGQCGGAALPPPASSAVPVSSAIPPSETTPKAAPR